MPQTRGLNLRQQAFVDAYCGNATEAAIAAGYSKKTAHSIGERLLRHVGIKEALQKREKERLAPLIANREQRERFWSEVMADPAGDMKDRLRASELLAKANGDFIERRELSGPGGAPFSPPVIRIAFDIDSGDSGNANEQDEQDEQE